MVSVCADWSAVVGGGLQTLQEFGLSPRQRVLTGTHSWVILGGLGAPTRGHVTYLSWRCWRLLLRAVQMLSHALWVSL